MLPPQTPIRFLCASSLVGLVSVVLATSARPALCTPDPWTLVKRVYAEPFPVDAVAIQKRSVGPRSTVTTRIVVSRRRSLVSRTLEPLMFQGHTVSDDGKTLRRYDPDTKIVIRQPSPLNYRPAINLRMAWAKENYTASLDGTATVAGREGYVVLLTPTYAEMSPRRMVIDTEKPFILKSEWQTSKKSWVVAVNTVEIRYEETDDVDMAIPDGAQELTEWGPRSLTGMSSSTVADRLGSTPTVPNSIPFGFHLVTRNAVGSSWENACLAYRLSDGVAMVTVYAWDPVRTPKGPFKQTPVMATSPAGLRIAAFGDVSPTVLDRISQAFAQGEVTNQEPGPARRPLTPLVEQKTRHSGTP